MLRNLAGGWALCPHGNWVVCPRWWNWVPLVWYMLTANHSAGPCWERCHVPRTFKNPSVVFDRSRNLSAPQQEAKLPDSIHLFLVAIKICRPYYPCVPPLFNFIIIILCSFYQPNHVHRLNVAEILLLWR